MVEKPWDYPWSSARFHVGASEEDFLVTDRSLMGLVKGWAQLLESSSEAANERLRKGARTGRPVGEEVFVQKIERLSGRTVEKGKPGRPRS